MLGPDGLQFCGRRRSEGACHNEKNKKHGLAWTRGGTIKYGDSAQVRPELSDLAYTIAMPLRGIALGS